MKITDFGIARATNSVPLTQTGAIMGTAYYISPEQASGQSVTPASDIYSLGIVAYECLTGRRPFDGDTPVRVALAQVSQEPPALPPDAARRRCATWSCGCWPRTRPTGRRAPATSAGRRWRCGPTLAAAATEALDPPERHPHAARGRRDRRAAPAYAEETTVVTPRLGTDTDPGFRLPDVSRAPHWLPYAIALAVAGPGRCSLAVRACGSDRRPPQPDDRGLRQRRGDPRPPPPSTSSRVDYLGRPVADVRADLVGLGLAVDVQRSAGGGRCRYGEGRGPDRLGRRPGRPITLDVVGGADHRSREARQGQGPRRRQRPGKGRLSEQRSARSSWAAATRSASCSAAAAWPRCTSAATPGSAAPSR